MFSQLHCEWSAQVMDLNCITHKSGNESWTWGLCLKFNGLFARDTISSKNTQDVYRHHHALRVGWHISGGVHQLELALSMGVWLWSHLGWWAWRGWHPCEMSKAKVLLLMKHCLFQYDFAPFFKGSEVIRTTDCFVLKRFSIVFSFF